MLFRSARWEAYGDNGREHSGREVVEWARQGEALGAGEIHVAKLHYIKARAIERLYCGSANWEEQERCCREECAMAYYVAEIMGEKELMEEITAYCKEKLSWQITEQAMLFD